MIIPETRDHRARFPPASGVDPGKDGSGNNAGCSETGINGTRHLVRPSWPARICHWSGSCSVIDGTGPRRATPTLPTDTLLRRRRKSEPSSQPPCGNRSHSFFMARRCFQFFGFFISLWTTVSPMLTCGCSSGAILIWMVVDFSSRFSSSQYDKIA